MAGHVGHERAALLVAWLAALIVVGLRYAEPVLDGDLFWHMAYAKQMLARGTLVLDHTAFSWTPTSNAMIYCAWASELAFYALWQGVGAWTVFALRYLVIGIALALGAHNAWRAGFGRSLVVPALLLLVMLGSPAGLQIKPELFSFLFFNVVVWTYFMARLEALHGRLPAARFYVVPVVVLVWVNSHGGFVLVAPFLLVVVVGEVLNARLSPTLALPPRSRTHLLIAWTLCVVAVFATPYGDHYPLQLVRDLLLGATERPDAVWNAAHRGVFDAASLKLHLAEYGLALAAVLAFATALLARGGRSAGESGREGGRLDWAVLLANLACLALFLGPLRTTYHWPVVAVYSAMHLLRVRTAGAGEQSASAADWLRLSGVGQTFTSVTVGVMVFVGARAVYEARYLPLDRSWVGFGVSDANPVDEAAFLARADLGPRLYNIFDSGGYLIWRLDPQYKVMTDQRSFPYLAWFDDQYRFTNGEIFDTFLTKYPADVAIIDLAKLRTLDNFLASAEWQCVYYGRSAAVFVRAGTSVPDEAMAVAPGRFDDIRNPGTAERVARFAARVGDETTARAVQARLASW